MSEIRGYTLRQFREYSRAASRQRRERMRDEAVIARAAQYGDKEFARFLKGLEVGDDGD